MAEHLAAAIGGYFGLELPSRGAWHRDAVALNSGRNALRYLLDAKRPTKVHVPIFTCGAVIETIAGLGIALSRYRIDEAMEPFFDYCAVGDDEVFLYTNYFGLKDGFVRTLASRGVGVIIDNAQSFFSRPVDHLPTFYSPRKFFGVPDGGYAYGATGAPLERDSSSTRMEHLLVRHDASAHAGYAAYQANEGLLAGLPPKAMSALSERILGSIDYEGIAARRRRNFRQLHRALHGSNDLPIDDEGAQVPLTYPYLSHDRGLKARLQAQNIFTASYWPDVARTADPGSVEHHYATQIVHLPIDQRYGAEAMQRILAVTLS